MQKVSAVVPDELGAALGARTHQGNEGKVSSNPAPTRRVMTKATQVSTTYATIVQAAAKICSVALMRRCYAASGTARTRPSACPRRASITRAA